MRMLIKRDSRPALVVAPRVVPQRRAELVIIIPCALCHLAASGHPGDSSPGCHLPSSSCGDSPAQGLCLTEGEHGAGDGFTLGGCLRSCSLGKAPGQHRAILPHTHTWEAGMQPRARGGELEVGWRAPSTPYPTSPPPHPTHRQGLNLASDSFLPNLFSCMGKPLLSLFRANVCVLPGSSTRLLSLSSPASAHLPC